MLAVGSHCEADFGRNSLIAFWVTSDGHPTLHSIRLSSCEGPVDALAIRIGPVGLAPAADPRR
jgi:hypothetical protein